MFPVEDEECKKAVKHILSVQLADNVKAHILQPDGSYVKIDKRGKTLVNSQAYFCKEAVGEAKDMEEESLQIRRVFEPLYHVDE